MKISQLRVSYRIGEIGVVVKKNLVVVVVGIFAFIGCLSANAQLNQKLCSGAISDLNCYAGLINQQAQELNRSEEAHLKRAATINGNYKKLTKYYKGRQIVLDTTENSCAEIRAELLSYNLQSANSVDRLENLCEPDPRYPFDTVRTITIMGEVNEDYIRS